MLLPVPDYLEFQLPSSGTCLVTDDGSLLTKQVVQRLSDQGWPVVVLKLPATLGSKAPANLAALPKTVEVIGLADVEEATLQQQLATIAQQHGTIHTFIHLHPQEPLADKELVKTVFFLAKHLQPFLASGHQRERYSFITVARLDGELGCGNIPYQAVGGGLFGLTKTLRLEWPTVFCRALDISPELSPADAANALIAEMHDPNLFIREVGYGHRGRVTIVCLPATT